MARGRNVQLGFSIVAVGYLAHGADLISGLGGPRGYGEASLAREADISEEFSLPFDIELFGATYDRVSVAENGVLSFGGAFKVGQPESFPRASGLPLIAPWWADVDTRADPGDGSNAVYVASLNEESLVITWDGVGFYDSDLSKRNSFQVILKSRSDLAPGNFDFEFRYSQLEWTTGDASGGVGGLGGTPAQVGYDSGDGADAISLPGALTQDALNLLASGNVGQPGRWVFSVRDGQVQQGPECPTEEFGFIGVEQYQEGGVLATFNHDLVFPPDGQIESFEWTIGPYIVSEPEPGLEVDALSATIDFAVFRGGMHAQVIEEDFYGLIFEATVRVGPDCAIDYVAFNEGTFTVPPQTLTRGGSVLEVSAFGESLGTLLACDLELGASRQYILYECEQSGRAYYRAQSLQANQPARILVQTPGVSLGSRVEVACDVNEVYFSAEAGRPYIVIVDAGGDFELFSDLADYTPTLMIIDISRQGTLRMLLSGEPQREYLIETSMDLLTWSQMLEGVFNSEAEERTGNLPPKDGRFYRIRQSTSQE